MEPFLTHVGLVAPIDRANVDTDQIIPKQYLKSIRRTGFGVNLFDPWRYLDQDRDGAPGAARRVDPDFVLNQPRYRGASVLLARSNFGCGSSPWALAEYGFRVLLAPSFAEIFYNNCFKNGLLPIVLPDAQVDALFAAVASLPGYRLTIDLPQQLVTTPAPEGRRMSFEIDPFRKESLVNGWDEIGRTLRHAAAIRAFEAARLARMPWLSSSPSSAGGADLRAAPHQPAAGQ